MRTKLQYLQQWEASLAHERIKSWAEKANAREFSGTPLFFIFVDMDYFCLISPVGWIPSAYKQNSIVVPEGFVTDFASVPRLFWSWIPPIGRYGYAALFHDYLYWEQPKSFSRAHADRVFRETMIELRVPVLKREVLYFAVRAFGVFAWRGNAKLKKAGERRILKIIPRDLNTTWCSWKQVSGVF